MDGEEPTQATQNVLDPRRLGKQNSGFSDDDISDILCILYPHSDSAREEVRRLAREDSPYIIGKKDVDIVEPDYDHEDHASRFDSNPTGEGNSAIILRLSSTVKNPAAGFAFGRNHARCDVVFTNDPMRRLSNIHFRIYVNQHGNVMIEDTSTNGTFVDRHLLTSHPKDKAKQPVTRWVLSSGSVINIYLHQELNDLTFRVRIPRRDDEYDRAYTTKVAQYFARHALHGKTPTTSAPVNPGPPDIFRAPAEPIINQKVHDHPHEITQQISQRREPREWTGSGKYNRIGRIGKGAFAVVYKVTSKYDGNPYAAKELEKRRFIKNGVLDQKVENEMKIMQRVQHPNIVRYVETFDWEDRLLIIIMEYVPCGDLGKFILEVKALPEDMVQTMSKQLLSALGYLHANNITHRDVKPDNILIEAYNPFEVKLTDFGLSKMVDTEQTFLRTFCGTLLYCAPEVYTEYSEYDDNGMRNRGPNRRVPGQRYNHAVDIWSLGGVIFYALTAAPPYPVKSGISYSELLHKIMTTRLNIAPLERRGVTEAGIDFLSRMLQRKPENRASIVELDTHSWLGGPGSIIDPSQSYDEITDDEDMISHAQNPGYEEDRISDSMGEESEKENDDTFGQGQQHQHQPQRLFGEVGVSAIGSSGVIPDDFLNLSNNITGMAETELHNSREDRADGSGLSTLAATYTHRRPDRQATVSIVQQQSTDQLQSLVEDVASQSLGGNDDTEQPPGSSYCPSFDFNTSKRKPPSNDTSDEFDNPASNKPLMKRLKSDGNIDELSGVAVEEYKLLACMPQIRRLGSGRQIDGPVSKVIYWVQDRSTWHLHYPEMTQLQHDAFSQAARERKEDFAPGKTPLWDLAMKHFGPSSKMNKQTKQSRVPPHIGLKRDDRKISDDITQFPPTAPVAMPSDQESIPDTLIPDTQIIVPVQVDAASNRAVGIIESHAHSCVTGISFPITDSLISFGRGSTNTETFQPITEPRVPKYAFKILLWKEGYDPSKDPAKKKHPWLQESTGDEDSYSFWISTKATLGIRINGHDLPSSDPKNPSGPSWHWSHLYDGDDLIIWGGADLGNQTALTFRCFWGASSHPRKDRSLPLEMASEDVAKKLDHACQKTEIRIRDIKEKSRRVNEANADLLERQRMVEHERERSRQFEAKRLEAVEFLQARQAHLSSWKVSTTSAPPAANRGRTAQLSMISSGGDFGSSIL